MNITHKIISSVTNLLPKSKSKKDIVSPKEVELVLQNVRAKIYFAMLFSFMSILLIYLFKDYFSPIFFAILFAVLIHPVYKYIYKKTHSQRISTILSTIFMVLVIVLPFVFIASRLVAEISSLSANIGDLSSSSTYQTTVNSINKIASSLPFDVSQQQIDNAINNLIQNISSSAVSFTSNLIKSAISFGVYLMIFIVLFVYLLPRMNKLKEMSLSASPLGRDITQDYIEKVRLLMKGTVVGSFVISLTASTIMGITFWALGIPNAVFLASIAFILGFIPYLGTTIFTFGGAIIFALMGNYFNAAVLILVQLVILNQLDLVFRPITLPKKVRIHPSLTIVAVTAGLAVFGVMGIFYGTIILVLFISTLQIYKQNYGSD